MATYFNDFPKINYTFACDEAKLNTVKLVNILRRFKPLDDIMNNLVLYYTYQIKEGERPDIVSYKMYDSVEYDWVILMFNQKIDPYFEWPMDSNQFFEYIENKYGSLSAATSTVHQYEKIIQDRTVLTDGTIIPERKLVIDSTAYAALPANERNLVYKYDYEFDLNEARRDIKILDSGYLPQLRREKQRIFG